MKVSLVTRIPTIIRILFDRRRIPSAIIRDGELVRCSRRTYRKWQLSDPNRHVGNTTIGPYHISTVFLTGPYPKLPSHDGQGRVSSSPHIEDYHWFETLVTSRIERGEIERRYTTFEEAERGHRKFVRYCRMKLRKLDPAAS